MDNSGAKLPAPPIFGLKGGDESYSKAGIISLDDIFEDFLLPADAKKFQNELENSKFDDEDDFDDDDDDDDGSQEAGEGGKKRKKMSREMQRNMTEEQKVERRFVNVETYAYSRFRLLH